jgi:hypothetical protein
MLRDIVQPGSDHAPNHLENRAARPSAVHHSRRRQHGFPTLRIKAAGPLPRQAEDPLVSYGVLRRCDPLPSSGGLHTHDPLGLDVWL